MEQMPQDLPIFERDAVRVVVRDSEGRILLFHTHEMIAPELGQWWELPGGGIDEGETYLEAAMRELREEAGIAVDAVQVGEPSWRRSASFRHRDRRHLQHEVVVQVRLGGLGAVIDETGRFDDEREVCLDFRWWPINDVVGSSDPLLPTQPAQAPATLPGRGADRRTV